MQSLDRHEEQVSGRSKRKRVHFNVPITENPSGGETKAHQKPSLDACKGLHTPPNCCSTSTAFPAASGTWLRGTVDSRRVRCVTTPLTEPKSSGESVVCVLQRDLRLQDNWALLFAQDAALSLEKPLHVLHLVAPGCSFQRTTRHLQFHLQGVQELAVGLTSHNIPFHCFPLLSAEASAAAAEATDRLKRALQQLNPRLVVCDLMPLRLPAAFVKELGLVCKEVMRCPLYQTDAHNVVPVWLASHQQEYAARTFRPRVMSLLEEFGCDFPQLQRHPHTSSALQGGIANILQQQPQVDEAVQLPPQWVPGAAGGFAALKAFCSQQRLAAYPSRNNPLLNTQSGLSPWLHFGQIAAQRCLLAVRALGPATKIGAAAAAGRESFIEELVVRRELAENFTFYNGAYDKIEGAPRWAQETLEAHRGDKREYVYSLAQFEAAKTHDVLWNAAQLQLVHVGKMHGFLRMYWAKKILEWSPSAQEALSAALHLNDKFSLDGTDPNGIVGCMWSVAGVHDQGWAERPVFGKIRYMNLSGCRRKFPVDEFVQKVQASTRKLVKETHPKTRNKQKEPTARVNATLALQPSPNKSTKKEKRQ